MYISCAGLRAKDIDILVVNCSLFNPTPSLSAMIVNHFKMRSNVLSYNLAGLFCNSAHSIYCPALIPRWSNILLHKPNVVLSKVTWLFGWSVQQAERRASVHVVPFSHEGLFLCLFFPEIALGVKDQQTTITFLLSVRMLLHDFQIPCFSTTCLSCSLSLHSLLSA